MFLNQVLKPYGLQSLGRAFAIAGVAGMIVPGIVAVQKFLRTPGKAAKMKRANMLTSALIATAILSFVAFFRSLSTCIVQSKSDLKMLEMFELSSGKVEKWHTQPGSAIKAGEPICVLENLELRIQRKEAEGEVLLAEKMLMELEQLAATKPQQASLIDATRSAFCKARSSPEDRSEARESRRSKSD